MYEYRTLHMVVIGLGVLPFLIWGLLSRSLWPETDAAAYLLTAWLVLTLAIGYPGTESRWHWKPVALMAVLHFIILTALVEGTLAMTRGGFKPPAVMYFGAVAFVLMAESWLALYVIERFLCQHRSDADE